MQNNILNTNHILPCYAIRKSKRAKRLSITVSARKGVEVVIPTCATELDAKKLVQQHQDWIQAQLAKLPIKPNRIIRPTEILLRSVQQLWHIDYIADDKRPRYFESVSDNALLLRGNEINQHYKSLLINWSKKQALRILSPWLQELSIETKLPYKSLTIRSQQTRWGSCSSDKKINLNYKLIFLPEPLVENVLLHELCHTKQMNHSEKFWNLMQQHNPKAIAHDNELKSAQKYLPEWL